MKIFNSFDTKLKQKKYNKFKDIFGEGKVLIIRRSFSFWLIKGIIPLFLYIIFSMLFYYYLYKFSYKYFITGANTLLILLGVISLIITLIILNKIYKIYINYKMDFCLVSPEELITYKQKGILKSNFKNIPVKEIRSIQSKHSGITGNLLNFGDITILTDGGLGAANEKKNNDASGAGMIKLTYVPNPNKTKEKISLICIRDGSLNEKEDKKDED